MQLALIKPLHAEWFWPNACNGLQYGAFDAFWDAQPLPSFDPVYDKLAHGSDDHRTWLKDALHEAYD